MKTYREFQNDCTTSLENMGSFVTWYVTEETGAGAMGGGAPTTNMGSGNIAGRDMPLGKVHRRGTFGGAEVFEVDSDTYHKCRLGKHRYHRWSKYVGESEVGQDIREYGKKNRGKAIIVMDSQTGAMMYLRNKTVLNHQK